MLLGVAGTLRFGKISQSRGVGLLFVLCQAFFQAGDGTLQGPGSEHEAQRGRILINARDDELRHTLGIAWGEAVGRIKHAEKSVGGRAVIGRDIPGHLGIPVTELGTGSAWFHDGHADTEGSYLPGHGLAEALDAELGGMVDGTAGIRHDTAIRRNLNDTSGTLAAHVGDGCADELHGSHKVGRNDVVDFRIRHLFSRAEEAVARCRGSR